ncbi:DNA-binding response regulator [Clostridium sp. 001]|uniref:terminase gpP N-terminus-related DNA-binding protein n=1 Tax=Clostridium sp. 001 TaxID=1970093 RepID=UPI001C2BCA73|nr:DNA-binding response regulator [Clostridium sp. 001]QXE19524.1 helix-turn-helix domain containing protein [Clostridium sp. 001]
MKKILDKEQVKELYIHGFSDSEIAKKLDVKKETVKKCIQRNCSNLKHEHQLAAVQKRETLKAINYEAKKYISDRSFIIKNRSIYKTNSSGDIVLDKKVAPVVTWDTPRRLTNENRC